MREKPKFPKCDHPGRVFTEEVMFEWFESCCAECYALWQLDCAEYWYTLWLEKGGALNPVPNDFGHYNVTTIDTTGKSGSGYWCAGVVRSDLLWLWKELEEKRNKEFLKKA